MRPNAPRIAQLLAEREDVLVDLQEAATSDQAAAARYELHAIAHSLWLAGYVNEVDA